MPGNAGSIACFPNTSWSLVERAGIKSQPEALAALLTRYLPALRSRLIVEMRLAPQEAEDLLQAFVADKVLEQGIVGRADRAKGKFRTFVLTVLDRYVVDCTRARDARARRLSQTSDAAVEEFAAPAADPAHGFDVTWAREVIDEALRRMDAQCAVSQRTDLWELFRCRVLEPALAGSTPTPYDQLVQRFGFASPAQASNALVTAKRIFERSLRSVVGEYAADDAEVQQELNDLRAILSGA